MMSDKVITSFDQVTADWLTTALASSGALERGNVVSFEGKPGRGNWSSSASLTLRYSDGASGSTPKHLFLKMVNTVESSAEESFGPSEVAYYTRDYVGIQNPPLLPCYHAAYSNALNRYHLLLEDVSETHIEAADQDPSLEYGYALAEGLAILHARWWGGRRLAEAGAPIHSPRHIQRFVDIAKPGVDHILNQFSGELEAHWPALLRSLYVNHPRAIIQRSLDENGFTLIHGDAGHNNILVPRTGERPIYIIDRQPFNWSLTTWLGVYDLAYAIVLDWDVELRRRLEIPILRYYHESLINNGVHDYSWEKLFDDYRLSVAMGVYIATEYCRGGVNERRISIWLPMLKRSLTACDDLACSELW